MDVRADVPFVHAGRLYWYELHIVPLTDPDSGPTARLVHLRDITPRKQAEEALRQANLELQARNAELDAFGHTVAHDLKNSLSAIIGYASMLDESYDRLPLNELHLCFQSIGEISHKMNNILEELMLLSGLRQIQVVMEPIDMGRIVGEAQQRLSTLIEKHQAEILCPATWPVATGYAPWVEEAWTNYLSNAIKYGGRPPRVQLGAEVQPDHTVRFWVQDNGHGLSPQAQARLFQPFERLDQARATGHGLGLSIVRRVVEKMGGHVGVESVCLPGQGCIFHFTLPAVEMPPQT